MAKPICRLIHISDLHFGSKFVIDGTAAWRKAISAIPIARQATSLFPHSYQFAGALAVAVRNILRESSQNGVPAIVVHTGDLTASGKQAEFSVGKTFLLHGHYLENRVIAGLLLDNEFGQLPFDIPGNHDLWQRGSPKHGQAFSAHYGGAYPRVLPIETPIGKVILYGLDSNRSTNWQHRLANGEIPTAALDQTCTELQNQRDSGAIQVVCIHHPLFVRRGTEPRLAGHEILRLKDRDKIAKQLLKSGAHVVLSGHVHEQQRPPRRKHTPLHYIAGSACQILSQPSFWTLDLYKEHVAHVHYQIPRAGIHFEPDSTRSGQSSYRTP